MHDHLIILQLAHTVFLLHCANVKCSALTKYADAALPYNLMRIIVCKAVAIAIPRPTSSYFFHFLYGLHWFIHEHLSRAFTKSFSYLSKGHRNDKFRRMRVSLHTIPRLFIDGCVTVAAGGRKTRANKARNGLHTG